jgi:hypothetical protein
VIGEDLAEAGRLKQLGAAVGGHWAGGGVEGE